VDGDCAGSTGGTSCAKAGAAIIVDARNAAAVRCQFGVKAFEPILCPLVDPGGKVFPLSRDRQLSCARNEDFNG
jgi:hypothetical protein